MKKKIKILIIVILIIMLFALCKLLKRDEISFDESLILINTEITDNMSLKINSIGIDENYLEEYYIKDKLAYKNFYANNENIQEFIFNFETKEQVNIFHNSKEIYLYKLEEQEANIILNKLDYYKELISKSLENSYKYYGKENINNNNVIKFSVDFEENFFVTIENPRRLYFYINVENNSIEKIEHYNIVNNKEELVLTDNFIYSYNTVTDENILKFNINDYPDYVIKNDEN